MLVRECTLGAHMVRTNYGSILIVFEGLERLQHSQKQTYLALQVHICNNFLLALYIRVYLFLFSCVAVHSVA